MLRTRPAAVAAPVLPSQSRDIQHPHHGTRSGRGGKTAARKRLAAFAAVFVLATASLSLWLSAGATGGRDLKAGSRKLSFVASAVDDADLLPSDSVYRLSALEAVTREPRPLLRYAGYVTLIVNVALPVRQDRPQLHAASAAEATIRRP